MRRLNIKLSVSLVVGLLATMAGVHVIHGIQIDKNADVLLHEAQRAEKEDGEKDKRRAVKKYGQYLKHRPNDVNAQERFALLAASLADQPGATQEDMKLAYRALDVAAKHPELTEVRRRIIDYYMRLGRFVDAIEYLEKLRTAALENGTREPALDVKYARCQIVVGHETTAIKVLDELVGYDEKSKAFDPDAAAAPDEIDAYLVLAEVLRRRRDDPERADEVMQQLAIANPDSPEAHLRFGRYALRQGRVKQAVDEFNRALELAPEDPDIILEVAEIDTARREFARVKTLLDIGVKKYPKNGEMYRALGSLALAQGREGDSLRIEKIDEAIAHVRTGLEQAPDSPTLMVFLVDLQFMKRDLDAASEAIDRMRKARFTQEFIDFYDATLAVERQKWPTAATLLEGLRPRMVRWPDRVQQINLALGQCYEKLGQPDRQAEAYRRALDADSKSLPARLGHSRALIALGRRNEGLDELQKVDRELRARKIVSPQVRSNMLKSRISEQLVRPSEQREWDDVDALVEEILADNELNELQKDLMRIELASLKGELEDADALLTPLLKSHPEEVRVWMSWLGIQERLAVQNRVSAEKQSGADRQQATQEAVEQLLRNVDIAEKAAGDQVPFRVVRAAAFARLGGEDAKQKLVALEEGIDKFSPDEQATLWEGLGNAYQRLNMFTNNEPARKHEAYEEVRRCFAKLVDRHPDDLFPWENMFDLALNYRETEAAQEAAEKIKKIAGGVWNPTYKYCAAALLIEQVIDGKVPASRLDDARKLVDEALRVRTEWHQLYRLQGEIDDLQGNVESAITNYQKAQELGSTNIAIAKRLVLLLFRQGRMQEVQAAMKRVGRENSNAGLDKIDIESKFRAGDQEAALKLAKESVAANPDDDTVHVFYGQLLDLEKPTPEAEEEFRAALKIKPDSQQVWLLLITHLVKADKLAAQEAAERADPQADKKAETKAETKAAKIADKKAGKKAGKNADKTVEKKADKMAEAAEAILEAKKSVPEDQLDSFLAQAYELVGDIPQAETHLLAWQEKNPDSLTLRRMIATFYSAHGMPEKARQQIEIILAPKPGTDDAAAVANRAWARRTLAEMLARQGNFADVQKAIELVQQNSPEGREASPADLRLIAGILATRPDSKSRDRAIQLYEKLAEQQMLDARERMMLSMLYNRSGKWSKAREEVMSLWVKMPKNPGVLGNLIQMLLEHDEMNNLDKWMEKLEDIAPAAKQPDGNLTMRLKSRWLAKQGKTKEAADYLKSLIPDTAEPAQLGRLGMIARLLEELQDYSDAEKYMLQWYEADPSQILAYAAFLGRRGKLDEAFALLNTAREKQPLPVVSGVAIETLRLNADKEATPQKKMLEDWLLEKIKETKDPAMSVRLNLVLVEVQDLQGRFDDSIKLYRSLLADPKLAEQQRAIIQNNLAFMLVTRAGGNNVAEAQTLVEKALAQLGPVPGVLDTRGLVRMAGGDAKQAQADFQTAASEAPTAVSFFHLAVAEEKLGNKTGVSEAFAKAEEMKLDVNQLSPGEKRDYQRLQKALAKPGKG